MYVFILGTRAQLIKTFPVMLELKKRGIEYKFIHTGQHDIDYICETFGIDKPDVVLTPPPKTSSKFGTNKLKAIKWNLLLWRKLKRALDDIENIDYVISHGDTMTAAASLFYTSKLLNPFRKYKTVHLEAGLRSGNIFEPFPEEIARITCDFFSDVLLTVSKTSTKNVSKFKNKKIINTGNSVMDSCEISYNMAKKKI